MYILYHQLQILFIAFLLSCYRWYNQTMKYSVSRKDIKYYGNKNHKFKYQ